VKRREEKESNNRNTGTAEQEREQTLKGTELMLEPLASAEVVREEVTSELLSIIMHD
jgi:hypothetical protein